MQLTEMLSLIVKGFWETLYMTLGSTVVAYAIGLPLGLLLILTDPQGLRPMPVFNRVLGVVINLLRSVPFIILLVWVMPVTRAIMGTTIGSKATLSPLTILPPGRWTGASWKRPCPWAPPPCRCSCG